MAENNKEILKSESLLTAAVNAAKGAAKRILAKHGATLRQQDLHKLSHAFYRVLVPRKRPGRKRTKRLDAAFTDWKSGNLRTIEMCSKHIPGFSKMGKWRRAGEQRKLMASLRARAKREKQRLEERQPEK